MIGIVYHLFVTGNWNEIVKEQFEKLNNVGLYDKTNIIWVTVNLNGHSENSVKNLLKKYNKIQYEFYNENTFEYPGIKKVKELGDNNDMKILYFHSKGVSNHYIKYSDNDISTEKINNIRSWRYCLEYFVLEKWKEAVELLNNNDAVGATNINGWYWGNFWWVTSNHIKKCRPVEKWGRWGYEAWLNDYVEAPKRFYEMFRFTYNPYVTFIDEEWYKTPEKFKNSKIILHKAEYGTANYAIDEGYGDYQIGVRVDVTSFVKKNLEKNNYEKIDIQISNENLGGDPIHGQRKFIFIEIELTKNPGKIYKIGTHEGINLNIEF